MKWILRTISSVVILVIIAGAVVLVPAHIQVRTVTPALPSHDQLLALTNLSGDYDGPTKISYILTSSQPRKSGQISHISILIEWQDGKRFLLDTGMDHQEAENFAALLQKMDSTSGQVTIKGSIAELLGDEIKHVTGVGFTHLHIDHTQGTKNFCTARGSGAVLLQTASQQKLHNFNTTQGAKIVSDSCLQGAAFATGENNNLYQSKQFPGIAAFELGGHTPGSTLWAVALGDRVFLFSGDTTNNLVNLHQDIPKSWLYSNLFVPENTQRTTQLRQWLNTLDQSEHFSVIVSHDLANTQRHFSEFSGAN